MKLLNEWPEYYKKDVVTHYCPGCGHGIVHRIVAELLEEMDLGKRAICVNPAGCAVLAYKYFDIDTLESAHGRGTAMATGIKRARPDLFSLEEVNRRASIDRIRFFQVEQKNIEKVDEVVDLILNK